MSEEEKKAIDYLKENSIVRIENEKIVAYGNSYKWILLNLIDKQQKEIEELKHNRDEYKEEYIKLINARYYNYISKDKIREKIKKAKEINWHTPKLVIEYFEELLEEK